MTTRHDTNNDSTLTKAMPYTSTLQTLILIGERHHKIPRLRVANIAHVQSDKLDSQPLAEKSCRDQYSLAPRRDLHQREGCLQLQGKQLRQGIRRGANLHPQFQRRLQLLPQIRHTPPSLQVVKQRFDTPTLGIAFHQSLSRQFRFSRQYQSRTRLDVIVLAHLAPHRPHRYPLQELRHGDDRA